MITKTASRSTAAGGPGTGWVKRADKATRRRRWQGLRPSAGAAVTGVIVLAGAAVLSVSGGQDVTQVKVQDSLQTSFANLWALQQTETGHPMRPTQVHPAATCDKGGPDVPDVGPGGDWICQMTWTGQTEPGKFELNVHANSCYTASGPGSKVGSFTVTDTDGREVTNPVYAFDVCMDADASA
ncbi:hypothetical protein [Quadrisphaera sp. INWT6]|uniref:hypothetical protein n=1 Tax=Quadrisphaera sp. INWT6 TaxID=2596917 RepID=UPI0018927B0E|nr:hypothetical protein [Quadrisphaera sp. INWT6]